VSDEHDERLENLEDEVDEEGRNLTQQRLDEEGPSDRPVDVDWEEPDTE
jgi:hypothetical protein